MKSCQPVEPPGRAGAAAAGPVPTAPAAQPAVERPGWPGACGSPLGWAVVGWSGRPGSSGSGCSGLRRSGWPSAPGSDRCKGKPDGRPAGPASRRRGCGRRRAAPPPTAPPARARAWPARSGAGTRRRCPPTARHSGANYIARSLLGTGGFRPRLHLNCEEPDVRSASAKACAFLQDCLVKFAATVRPSVLSAVYTVSIRARPAPCRWARLAVGLVRPSGTGGPGARCGVSVAAANPAGGRHAQPEDDRPGDDSVALGRQDSHGEGADRDAGERERDGHR